MTPRRAAEVAALRRLAALYGIQPSYFDVRGRRQHASPESLRAVLAAMGVPFAGGRRAAEATRARRAEQWRQEVDPVATAWDGRAAVGLRLPAGFHRPISCELSLEDGKTVRWSADPARLPTEASAAVGGTRFLRRRLSVPGRLPPGYHHLVTRLGRAVRETMLIAAPRRAFVPAGDGRTWGVFLPLYALHSERSWGSGDFSDLESLMDWLGDLGGGVVATLPLLAAFLDTPYEPSPYVPVSRLFWNEFYLDPARGLYREDCREVRALLASPGLRAEIAALRAGTLVDFRRVMRAKRQVLEALARCCFEKPSAARHALEEFVAAQPALEDYARFRAVVERMRTPWPAWPARLREGRLRAGDYDEAARRYHLYVQWLAHTHLRAMAAKARRQGAGLFLDLPLGVHPDGYDVWRERHAFAQGVSGGAPPDAFFTRGQNWGFPPLHPERLRAERYRYFIAAIRHHLQHAGVLRIDHIMGLHRLYWVPHGLEARDGAYVIYPAEELYAILTLESHRHRALIVGEDLGTVPPATRRAMNRHGVQRMYVVQYEAKIDPRAALPPISADTLAGLNTHDMPPFAAFWQGLDIRDRRALGLLDAAGARAEQTGRRRLKQVLVAFLRARGYLDAEGSRLGHVLRGLLAYLAASPARMVIISLEDLWQERQPQNVPGTGAERPNWQRRARFSFEGFRRRRAVTAMLRLVSGRRGQKTARS